MIRRILVPLDGTPFSECAIPYAVAIARRAQAVLELVHVHVPKLHDAPAAVTPYAYQHAPDYSVIADDDEFDAEAHWLEEHAARLRETTGLTISAFTVTGHPAETLCEEVAALAADLVIMATHARTGIDRLRFPAVADVVVRHAAAPVLLIPPAEDGTSAQAPTKFRRMLIPLDGSAFSEQVLPAARTLAFLMGAQPWLLHVVTPYSPPLRSDPAPGAIGDNPRAGEEYLAGVARAMAGINGSVVTTTMLDRRPADAICEAANDPDVDLVAMATHGRGGLSRLLLGSTGDEVVRHTNKPVLLFRPSTADALRDVFDPYSVR